MTTEQPLHLQHTICICVDDFGLHAGINRAAIDLAEQQRVHAISCMVGGPAWPQGQALLRGRQQLDVGLHLDLTEVPLQPHMRQPLQHLIAQSYRGSLDRHALKTEIHLQLDAFERGLGHPPHYIDGHQHVHQLPMVRTTLIDALNQRYSTVQRPWLRATHSPGLLQGAGLKASIIAQLGGRGLTTLARQHHYAHNHRLLGVYNFQGDHSRYSQWLKTWLNMARHGDLLMCHPSAENNTRDPLSPARMAEFSVLSSDTWLAPWADHHLALAPMSHILKQRAAPSAL